MSTKGIKHDGGKPRVELLPFDALLEVSQVFSIGAEKYGERNWEKGMNWSRLFGATLRHLSAWWQGEKKDPESGYSHLLHAGCNILFLIAYEIRGVGKDDRPQ